MDTLSEMWEKLGRSSVGAVICWGSQLLGQSAVGAVMTATDENSAICLLQVMKVEAGNDTGKKLNIIWDGGATVSLITTRKAAELEFGGTPSFSDRS